MWCSDKKTNGEQEQQSQNNKQQQQKRRKKKKNELQTRSYTITSNPNTPISYFSVNGHVISIRITSTSLGYGQCAAASAAVFYTPPPHVISTSPVAPVSTALSGTPRQRFRRQFDHLISSICSCWVEVVPADDA